MPTPDISEILAVLAEHSDGVSLPRLAKRLGQRASSMLRALAPYTAEAVGGQAGAGWIDVIQTDAGWTVHLTDAGRAILGAPP